MSAREWLRGRARLVRGLLLVLAASTGCGAESDAGPNPVFVAFTGDFAGFEQWARFEISWELPGSPHQGAQRTVFVNRLPDPGSASFPVGTILIKTAVGSDEVHAMVKRGGGYNQMGARDWEWFELRRATDGSLAIAWRGITPPAGVCQTYGGIAGGACNTCHQSASANDFVRTPALALSAIGH